ncbi:hypothetical protein IWQ62_000239 [Dispira parvispora]|uniref:SprT-like domain-containing protein n=1 Tax=Dispira parvispora TaxID=1520584 RepID=A0A9W8B135_9FUNG|nr:hypothetical protein IWQ62_000239 [Dispira parvispora]
MSYFGYNDKPDIQGLFHEYNRRYFNNAIQSMRVQWSANMPQKILGWFKPNDETGSRLIELNENGLRYQPPNKISDVILHEMIHAYLDGIGKTDHGYHGPSFLSMMQQINSLTGSEVSVNFKPGRESATPWPREPSTPGASVPDYSVPQDSGYSQQNPWYTSNVGQKPQLFHSPPITSHGSYSDSPSLEAHVGDCVIRFTQSGSTIMELSYTPGDAESFVIPASINSIPIAIVRCGKCGRSDFTTANIVGHSSRCYG